ncbi:18732_t:CDS:2, partial [Gigaspora margarita]
TLQLNLMDNINWNSFITFPTDLEDKNFSFSLIYCRSNNNFDDITLAPPSRPSNDNFDDISLISPSGPSNINFDDMNLALPSESSNNNFGDINLVPPFGSSNDNFVDMNLARPSGSSNNNFGDLNLTQPSGSSNNNFEDLNLARLSGSCIANFEQGFGYQIFCNDKDQNNPSIIRRKSYRYSSSGTYEARKVAPITQLEILKKKYPQHVFHKQDMYNAIYKLHQNNDKRYSGNERRLSGVFWISPSQQELYQRFSDIVLNDNTCKTNKYNMYLSVFMIKDNYGRFKNIANALVVDELSLTYIWILECLLKATNNASLNNASTLCEVEKVINKRHEAEIRYCKLTDIKAQHSIIGLPHILSKFFSNIDKLLVNFLPLQHSIPENLCDDIISSIAIISDNFIEDVVNEPQATLKAILDSTNMFDIIEIWRIHRIGGISHKYNLVVLLSDGTHICTCLETITKGIICHHFWRVMLYSSFTKFHISIIPIRWHKDDILTKLDESLNNSPVLTALESSSEHTIQENVTFQSLQNFQNTDYQSNIQHAIPQRNRFGVAFSIAKIAINIVLETKSDNELIQLLKTLILTKQNSRNKNDNLDESKTNENNLNGNSILTLQQNLIDQTNDPHVTKIRGAPNKKRLKSTIELSMKKNVMHETTNTNNKQGNDNEKFSSRPQRKCLLYGIPDHYKKKYPNAKEK